MNRLSSGKLVIMILLSTLLVLLTTKPGQGRADPGRDGIELLAQTTYWYRFHCLPWDWSPGLPPPFENWSAYGPATTSYNGKTYQVWVTYSGGDWLFYIRDTAGTIYRDFDDGESYTGETYYEDNNALLFGATSIEVVKNHLWIKLGHPAPDASITPPTQRVAMGEIGVYSVYVPCSSCDFTSPRVYRASGGDPPREIFRILWDSYSINGTGPYFTLEIAPYELGVKSFAFDTCEATPSTVDTTTVHYIVYGQIEGYQPDNDPPVISNVSHTPTGPTDSDLVTVQAVVTDASGVSTARLYHSDDGGSSWTPANMDNPGDDTWQATIPAHDAGTIMYRIEAADILAHTTTTGDFSYVVTDATPPAFSGWAETPSDLTEDSAGAFRVEVSVTDAGGSGLAGQTPQLDYRFASAGYDGYEDMAHAGGDRWYLEIPAQDWNARRGQTMYYVVRCTDVAGNLGTSDEQDELIDSINDPPEITSFVPTDLTPDVDVADCLSFSVTAHDGDDDPLNYAWELDGNTVSTSAGYTYCPGDQDVGDHTVAALVSDGTAIATRTWQVTVNRRDRPNAPSNLQATAISRTRVNLTWQDNASDESDLHVERSPDGSTRWTEIAIVGADATAYADTGLDCDTAYYYRVRAHRHGDGRYSAYSNVDSATICCLPGTPSLASPGPDTTTNDNTPTLEWDAVSHVSEYQVQVDDNPGFSSPEINATAAAPNYTPAAGLGDDTYSWRVRGYNTHGGCSVYGAWSSVWQVTIDTTPPSSAVDSLPAKHDSLDFDVGWAGSDAMSGVSCYDVQYRDGVGGTWTDWHSCTTDTSAAFHGVNGHTYYFRSRALDVAGNWEHYPTSPDYDAHTAVCTVLAAPAQTVPQNGVETGNAAPAFGWNTVSGATSYHIQVADDAGFSSPVISQMIPLTSYTPSTGLAPGTYYWRVQASHLCGSSPWSEVWAFTVLKFRVCLPIVVVE